MALVAGYSLRMPKPDYLEQVVTVVVDDELNDAGESTLGAHYIRAGRSRAPRNLDCAAQLHTEGTQPARDSQSGAHRSLSWLGQRLTAPERIAFPGSLEVNR